MSKHRIKVSNGEKGIWTYYLYDEFESYEEADIMGDALKKHFKDKGENIKKLIIHEGLIYPIHYLYLSKRIGEDNV